MAHKLRAEGEHIPLLGYGTLHAGPLEVEHVPCARQARDLIERLAG